MQLSQIGNPERDGIFESLGFLSHHNKNQLVYVEDAEWIPKIPRNVSCIITSSELAELVDPKLGIIISSNPKRVFYQIHERLALTDFYGKRFRSVVDTLADIHPTAYIADENVKIGPGCIIGPNATIMGGTILGNNVCIGAGTVIGSSALCITQDDEILPVKHTGGIFIGNRTNVGAQCCICRSVFGSFTEIGESNQIDNMVYIAHNVIIGNRNFLVAKSLIAGSVQIGNENWIGPGSVISSSIKIGNQAYVTLGSVVTKDVKDGQHVTGNFAIDHDKFISRLRESCK